MYVEEAAVEIVSWVGDWMDGPFHSPSASITHQVTSVKIITLFLSHDNKKTGGLEGQ